MTLQEAFEQVEDHRSGLVRSRGGLVKKFLVLVNGTPSHDTFGKVFRVLDDAIEQSID